MSNTPFRGAQSSQSLGDGGSGPRCRHDAGAVAPSIRSLGVRTSLIGRVGLGALLVMALAAPCARAEIAPVEGLRMILAPMDGDTREDREIAAWQQRLRANSEDNAAASLERLGWAFVAKARRTQDAGFYKLAETTADAMDARAGVTDESRLLRGHVLHNLHRFAEAEVLGRQLAEHRGQPLDWALLCDALMEQGKLTEAVSACQRFVNLRPGLEAYSRIAHLRWLTGDLAGATEAMEAAVRAGSPKDAETQAWTLSRLSYFYLQAGDTTRALATTAMAKRRAEGYPPALLAEGRALLAAGRIADAVTTLRTAVALNPLPDYQWWLADALRESGAEAEARQLEEQLRRHGPASDPRTLALFLATRGVEPTTAVKLAENEQRARRDVFTNDAVAWSYAAAGDIARADAAMKEALATRTADARLFLHAAVIAAAAGRASEAREWVERARPLAATLTPSEKFKLSTCLSSAPLAQAH